MPCPGDEDYCWHTVRFDISERIRSRVVIIMVIFDEKAAFQHGVGWSLVFSPFMGGQIVYSI